MKKNVLFFWIPKAAGTSIFKLLEKYGAEKLKYPSEYKAFSNQGSVTFGHVSVDYLLQQGYVTSEYFHNSFKFCVVRNPWSRLVSLYHYLKLNERISFREFVNLLDLAVKRRDTTLYRILQSVYNTNAMYSDRLIYMPYLRNHRRTWKLSLPLPAVGPYPVTGLSQANNQVDWITDQEGRLMVDYVCRFESLAQDFNKVAKIIGVGERLEHHNVTKQVNYRDYYDDGTKAVVGRIYRRDIESFGYEF